MGSGDDPVERPSPEWSDRDVLATVAEEGVTGFLKDRKEPGRDLSDLAEMAVRCTPLLATRPVRRWRTFDTGVVLAILLALGLMVRAGVIVHAFPEEPGPVGEGRTVLTLPIDPSSYALLGDLPTHVSAAVVPASLPDTAPPRPIAFFDDLLILEAEATEGKVAVVLAVNPGEVESLLAALPDATVYLLRRAVTESRTSSASPTTPSG